jgi:uncharacterized peroxidase-related enzyme
VDAIARDWRSAPLSEIDALLCVFAEKLTLHPEDMTAADVESLRSGGLDDRAIHDAVQIIGYFNYINRVADALGVEPETFIRPWGPDFFQD